MLLKLLGAALMASPLLALFMLVRSDGWRVALAVFGAVVAVCVVLVGGALLYAAGSP